MPTVLSVPVDASSSPTFALFAALLVQFVFLHRKQGELSALQVGVKNDQLARQDKKAERLAFLELSKKERVKLSNRTFALALALRHEGNQTAFLQEIIDRTPTHAAAAEREIYQQIKQIRQLQDQGDDEQKAADDLRVENDTRFANQERQHNETLRVLEADHTNRQRHSDHHITTIEQEKHTLAKKLETIIVELSAEKEQRKEDKKQCGIRRRERETEYEKVTKRCQDLIRSVDSGNKAMTEKLSNLGTVHEDLKEKHRALQKDRNELAQTLSKVEATKRSSETKIDAYKEAQACDDRKIRSLRREIVQKDGKLAAKQKEADGDQEEIADLKSAVDALAMERDQAVEDKNAVSGETDTLKSSWDSDKRRLEEELAHHKAKALSAANKAQTIASNFKDVKAAKQSGDKQIQRLEERYSSLLCKKDELVSEVADLKGEITRLNTPESENHGLREENASLMRSIENVKHLQHRICNAHVKTAKTAETKQAEAEQKAKRDILSYKKRKDKEIASLRKQADADVRSANENRDRAIEEAKSNQGVIAALQKELEDPERKGRAEDDSEDWELAFYKHDLENTERECKEEIDKKDSQIASLKKDLEDLAHKWRGEKASKDSQIASLQKELEDREGKDGSDEPSKDSQIASLKKVLEDQRRRLRTEMNSKDRQIADLKNKSIADKKLHDSDIATVKNAYKIQVSEQDKTIKRLEKELEASEKTNDETLSIAWDHEAKLDDVRKACRGKNMVSTAVIVKILDAENGDAAPDGGSDDGDDGGDSGPGAGAGAGDGKGNDDAPNSGTGGDGRDKGNAGPSSGGNSTHSAGHHDAPDNGNGGSGGKGGNDGNGDLPPGSNSGGAHGNTSAPDDRDPALPSIGDDTKGDDRDGDPAQAKADTGDAGEGESASSGGKDEVKSSNEVKSSTDVKSSNDEKSSNDNHLQGRNATSVNDDEPTEDGNPGDHGDEGDDSPPGGSGSPISGARDASAKDGKAGPAGGEAKDNYINNGDGDEKHDWNSSDDAEGEDDPDFYGDEEGDQGDFENVKMGNNEAVHEVQTPLPTHNAGPEPQPPSSPAPTTAVASSRAPQNTLCALQDQVGTPITIPEQGTREPARTVPKVQGPGDDVDMHDVPMPQPFPLQADPTSNQGPQQAQHQPSIKPISDGAEEMADVEPTDLADTVVDEEMDSEESDEDEMDTEPTPTQPASSFQPWLSPSQISSIRPSTSQGPGSPLVQTSDNTNGPSGFAQSNFRAARYNFVNGEAIWDGGSRNEPEPPGPQGRQPFNIFDAIQHPGTSSEGTCLPSATTEPTPNVASQQAESARTSQRSPTLDHQSQIASLTEPDPIPIQEPQSTEPPQHVPTASQRYLEEQRRRLKWLEAQLSGESMSSSSMRAPDGSTAVNKGKGKGREPAIIPPSSADRKNRILDDARRANAAGMKGATEELKPDAKFVSRAAAKTAKPRSSSHRLVALDPEDISLGPQPLGSPLGEVQSSGTPSSANDSPPSQDAPERAEHDGPGSPESRSGHSETPTPQGARYPSRGLDGNDAHELKRWGRLMSRPDLLRKGKTNPLPFGHPCRMFNLQHVANDVSNGGSHGAHHIIRKRGRDSEDDGEAPKKAKQNHHEPRDENEPDVAEAVDEENAGSGRPRDARKRDRDQEDDEQDDASKRVKQE